MREHIEAYLKRVHNTVDMVRMDEVEAAWRLLHDVMQRDGWVYLCGNGGSAATASHLAVDLGKNLKRKPNRRMRVLSLTDNVPWITALANDLSYDDCFSEQLRNYIKPGDLIIGISASGDSENVVRAFRLAQDYGADRLALIGFDGGRLAKLASAKVWIESYDYGLVESVHGIVAHMLVGLLNERQTKDHSDASEQLTPDERQPVVIGKTSWTGSPDRRS